MISLNIGNKPMQERPARFSCAVTFSRDEVMALDHRVWVRNARGHSRAMLHSRRANYASLALWHRQARNNSMRTARAIRDAQRGEAAQ